MDTGVSLDFDSFENSYPEVDRYKYILVYEISKVLPDTIKVIDHDAHFADLGIDSVMGARLVASLSSRLSLEIEVESFYDYPSISQYAEYLYLVVNSIDQKHTLSNAS